MKKSVKDVLRELNIEYRDKGRYVMIPCPFHKETEPSLAIYLDNLTFYCFGCKKYGRYEEALGKILGIDPLSVSRYLEGKVVATERQAIDFVSSISQKEFHEIILVGNTIADKYLMKRGIKNPEIYKCGYDSISDRLVIPVHFNKELIGFESRALDKNDKYKYKALYFEKTSYVFGWDYIDWSLDYLIIVESSISVMYLRNNFGIKNCIAFMGTVFNRKRKELINSFNPKKLFVWFDNDLAGREAGNKLLEAFGSIYWIHSDRDPDELENLDSILVIKIGG